MEYEQAYAVSPYDSAGSYPETVTTIAPTNRGHRIWIEGQKLVDAGFKVGARYDIEYTFEDQNPIRSFEIIYTLNADGKKKVSNGGRAERPIIDLHNQKIQKVFKPESRVCAEFGNGWIRIHRLDEDIWEASYSEHPSLKGVYK